MEDEWWADNGKEVEDHVGWIQGQSNPIRNDLLVLYALTEPYNAIESPAEGRVSETKDICGTEVSMLGRPP